MQKRMDFASLATSAPDSSATSLEPAAIFATGPAAAPAAHTSPRGSSIGGWLMAAAVLVVGVVILYLAWTAMQTTKKLNEVEGSNTRLQMEIAGVRASLGQIVQMQHSQMHVPVPQHPPAVEAAAETEAETVAEVSLPPRAQSPAAAAAAAADAPAADAPAAAAAADAPAADAPAADAPAAATAPSKRGAAKKKHAAVAETE